MRSFFAEEERKFVAHLNAGVGYGDGEEVVLDFERDKVVAKHEVGGDGAK